MPSTAYRDDAPGPGSTVWYATGLGWRQADGGALASGWNRGDPDGRGTPSTAAEEQVRAPAFPPKKNNPDFSVTVSPTDIPAYSMAAVPLWRAQGASEPSPATKVAATATERTEASTESGIFDRHAYHLQRLAERISWLEWELANPPVAGNAYQVMVGPWQQIGVHIPVEIVQQSIRAALTDMRRERERGLQRG